MAGADLTVARRLQALVGSEASIGDDARGIPTVAPSTTAACALVLQTAHAEGWTVRLAGNQTWMPSDAPAQLTLCSRRLVNVDDIRASDLVAAVQAGVDWETLRLALADEGAWWPVDPPGTKRTLGSLVATATAGPLRAGFGGIRDHILGLTIVTADGRIVRTGGRVAKNVAGYDLTKLAVGSFGAFGFITSIHLRLRAIPRADITLVLPGERDSLIQNARAILDAGLTPGALEVLSPAAAAAREWCLAVRLVGSGPSVTADRAAVHGACPMQWEEMPPHDAAGFWRTAVQRSCTPPVTIRIGTVISDLHQAMDLIAHHLDDDFITASISAGVVRWSGEGSVEHIHLMRRAAAQLEMPVTVERAPWPLRHALGHFGAYREGVGRLMGSLRHTFDPRGTLVVALAAASS